MQVFYLKIDRASIHISKYNGEDVNRGFKIGVAVKIVSGKIGNDVQSET